MKINFIIVYLEKYNNNLHDPRENICGAYFVSVVFSAYLPMNYKENVR